MTSRGRSSADALVVRLGAVSRLVADQLESAAVAAASLHADGGWRGERVAQAFLAALPGAAQALGAGELGRWGKLAPAVRAGLDEGLYFRALPRATSTWTVEERSAWLDA